MGKLILFILGSGLGLSLLTTLYLTVRHYHRKWYWGDKANENSIRRAVLDEIDVQWEVDGEGMVRPVRRSEYGHGARS